MDPDLKLWTDRQDASLEKMAAEGRRQTDSLTLIGHQLATIIGLLAPAQPTDEPTSLELLLASLVAQGKETLSVLKELAAAIARIERGQSGDIQVIGHVNGHGKGTTP